jgi:type VI secretion system VasI family protein
MRLLAVLVAICALSQTAIAQTSECKSITDSDTRLACYDRIAATAASSAAVKPALRTAPPPKAAAASAYVDSISAEDALMNARLKNICRGC